MGWIKQSDDTYMPIWLKANLSATCSTCGAEKENFYNARMECTNRRCSNPKCPKVLAQRIADMCEFLKVPGIREGKGLQLVQNYDLQSHFEAIPHIFSEKPKMSLASFMRIAFIPGIDSKWEDVCGSCTSVDELYEKCGDKYKPIIATYISELRKGETFVEITRVRGLKYEPLIWGNVMLSGNIRGFNPREQFVAAVNVASQGLISLKVVGKRKTDVMCLIQEADEPHRGKYECAIQNGIPIMTPTEFQTFIAKQLSDKLSNCKPKERGE